jgi:hypothetical protein
VRENVDYAIVTEAVWDVLHGWCALAALGTHREILDAPALRPLAAASHLPPHERLAPMSTGTPVGRPYVAGR